MIRILEGLDRLVHSDRDIQVKADSESILFVTALDEFYIDDVDDAEVLRDLLTNWIEARLRERAVTRIASALTKEGEHSAPGPSA